MKKKVFPCKICGEMPFVCRLMGYALIEWKTTCRICGIEIRETTLKDSPEIWNKLMSKEGE